MKKLMYLSIALLMMAGCTKTEELITERPEIRMHESIADLKTKLSTAENGWNVALSTLEGGGFGFYMHFDGKDLVKMYADYTDESATQVKESSYRLRADMGATLVFDTYNYITMLVDPDPNVFGGIRSTGFKSDIEFIYNRSTVDTILFIGKKYRQQLVLVKASAQQRERYQSLEYRNAIHNFNDAFYDKNRYIEVQKGSTTLKVGIEVNTTNTLQVGKRIKFTGILPNGQIVSSEAKFAYTIDGISILVGGLVWQDITFVRLAWVNSTTLAVYDSNGKEYILNNNVQPLIPLHLLWGNKYTKMVALYPSVYPGSSTQGADIVNRLYTNMATRSLTRNYAFSAHSFTYTWDVANKRLRLGAVHAQGVQTWTTTIVYAYTGNEDNQYTFTQYTPATSGYAQDAMADIHAVMLSNRFSFDYYAENGVVYAKMTSITNPLIVMTFMLQ